LQGDIPAGTRITDMEDKEIDRVLVNVSGPDGFTQQVKIVYPAESIEDRSGNVRLDLSTTVHQYVLYYATSLEKNQYGDIQDYILDTDPTIPIQASAISKYSPAGDHT